MTAEIKLTGTGLTVKEENDLRDFIREMVRLRDYRNQGDLCFELVFDEKKYVSRSIYLNETHKADDRL